MRRKFVVLLIVVVALVVGSRMLPTREKFDDTPNRGRTNLVQYKPLTPLKNPTLAELQNSVDLISESAMEQNWNTAMKDLSNLEQNWRRLQQNRPNELALEQEISLSIQNLHYNVYGQNQQEILKTAKRLTELIGRLSR